MASAARRTIATPLPSGIGRVGDNLLGFYEGAIGVVQLADDSERDLPAGTTGLITQSRKCGDFYCEIKGRRHVSGIGETVDAAFLAALDKAQVQA